MNKRAFTLIEVIVALALSGLLVVGLNGMSVGAHRAAGTVQQRSEQVRRSSHFGNLLRDDLDNRSPGNEVTLNSGHLRLSTMNSLANQRMTTRHGVEVEYALESGAADNGVLLRREWELSQEPGTDGIPVLKGIKSVRFHVFDGQKWLDAWPPPVFRPGRALRIDIAGADGKPRTEVIALSPIRWRRHDE